MDVERPSAPVSLLDVLDRVLDKGIVIDAWVRLSLAGIDLVTVHSRVVVASIETYLYHPRPDGAGRQPLESPAPKLARVRRAAHH